MPLRRKYGRETGCQRHGFRPAFAAPPILRMIRLSFCYFFACLLSPFVQAASLTSYAKDVKPLLEKYCWDCHGDGAKKGDLNLDPYTDDASILKAGKIWGSVEYNVENWMMPPPKKTQPTPAEREVIAHYIDRVLNPFDATKPDPGRVTIRRLNRVEYNNTMRDLLGVDVKPANDFPEDDTGYGFDTIGDVLTIPPILMERYLTAADKVLEAAMPNGKSTLEKIVYKANTIKGDGQLVDKKVFLLTSEGLARVQHEFPMAGEYVLRAKAYANQAGNEVAKVDLRLEGGVLKTFELTAAAAEKPQVLEARFKAEAGQQRIGLRFLNDFYDEKAADPNKRDRNVFLISLEVEGPLAGKGGGSGNAAQKIFGAGAALGETEAGARAILQVFANRAFRRSAIPAEVQRLLTIFQLAQKKGENFREALKLSMKAILVSPYFIYRTEWQAEANNPAMVVELNEFSLASRMAYFLWSSMPDDELLSLAFRNELRKNLPAQITRMLKDPKARALAQNFAGQWLEIRTLDVVQPDQKRFRFPTPLREAMKQETEEFFWYIQQENRSLLDFVGANYTFVNDRLATHYGLPGVTGGDFRKVELPASTLRRGILTQGSVLTLTSDPVRTSPVKRGKWITENILGIAAPPPPPNVPPLDANEQGALQGTVRQRLEKHRTNPGCASCHALLDPMGFGLENFDAIGVQRTQENGVPVDTMGVLTTGQQFHNAIELSDIIMKDKRDAFLRCVTKKMFTYALGRAPEAYDRPAIDTIIARLGKDNNRFQTLVTALIESLPFQKRRGDSAAVKAK